MHMYAGVILPLVEGLSTKATRDWRVAGFSRTTLSQHPASSDNLSLSSPAIFAVFPVNPGKSMSYSALQLTFRTP